MYFFEYVASVGGSASAQPKEYANSGDWFLRNSYAILAFCYQVPVLFIYSLVMGMAKFGYLQFTCTLSSTFSSVIFFFFSDLDILHSLEC